MPRIKFTGKTLTSKGTFVKNDETVVTEAEAKDLLRLSTVTLIEEPKKAKAKSKAKDK